MLTLSFNPSVTISKLFTSLLTSNLYSYTLAEKSGVSLYPFISSFFKSKLFDTSWVIVSVFSDSSLVTFIVYVCVFPFSAVTITWISLVPTSNLWFPVPEVIWAFESCTFA